MTQETSVPRFCPYGCGEQLFSVRVSGPCLERIKSLPDSNKINFDESYGIVCKKCGYGSQLLVFKK